MSSERAASISVLQKWSGVLCSLLEFASEAELAFDRLDEEGLLSAACGIAQLHPRELSNAVVPILKDWYNLSKEGHNEGAY